MHKVQTSSLQAGGALNNFTLGNTSTSALPPNCSSVITRAPGTTWTGLHPVFLFFDSTTWTPSDESIIYRNFPNITFFLSALSAVSVTYWKQTMLQRKVSLISSDIILHPLVFQAKVLYSKNPPVWADPLLGASQGVLDCYPEWLPTSFCSDCLSLTFLLFSLPRCAVLDTEPILSERHLWDLKEECNTVEKKE